MSGGMLRVASQQKRATRNADADVVRLERHGLSHLLNAALPQFAAGLHVALLKRLAGGERQSRRRATPALRRDSGCRRARCSQASMPPVSRAWSPANAREEIGRATTSRTAGWPMPRRGLRRGEKQRSDERDNDRSCGTALDC